MELRQAQIKAKVIPYIIPHLELTLLGNSVGNLGDIEYQGKE